jgi:hypothetical protein
MHVGRKTIKGVSAHISFSCVNERPYYGEPMRDVPVDILEQRMKRTETNTIDRNRAASVSGSTG